MAAKRKNGPSGRIDPLVAARRAAGAVAARNAPPDSRSRTAVRTIEALYEWDRLDEESDARWDLFRTWRDYPYDNPGKSRPSIPQHARDSLSPRTGRPRDKKVVMEIAAKHNWVVRARAYDRWVDTARQNEIVESRRQLARQAGVVGDLTLAVLAVDMNALLDKVRRHAKLGRGAYHSPQDLERLARALVPLAYKGREFPDPPPGANMHQTDDDPVSAGGGGVVGKVTSALSSQTVRDAIGAWMAEESERRVGDRPRTAEDELAVGPDPDRDIGTDNVDDSDFEEPASPLRLVNAIEAGVVDDNPDLVDGFDVTETMDQP